ncbi:MAG TPA: sodium:solute symporter family protein [Caldithrix sp.]|nr:sodium:solute symporter family protein [Caldithrix sp.]
MIKLHPLEILPIVLYLVLLLFIGFRSRSKKESEDDFIVGGRRLTLPAFVATLVSTWYGGILGVGEFTYLYGLSNWVVFGLPYYIFAIIFALFLAPRVRQSQLMSIPDQLFRNYGKTNGFIGTAYTFFMTLPAPYVLMVGLMLQMITGWSLWICLLLGTLFSIGYVLNGGFRSVVRTDKLQFALMFGGFLLMLAELVSSFGGIGFLKASLPPRHLTIGGSNSAQYIVVWFFIALWTLIDPGFHQRCYAARTPQTARRGILISVLFWMVFDFLTTSTGLYARALLQDIQPILSYPLLSHQILPPLLSGLFLTGLLATIMSTLDSYFLLSAITIGHDFWGNLKGGIKPGSRYTRIGLVIAALLSIGPALLFPSVIQLWYLIGSLFIPPMLLPVLGSYYRFFRLKKTVVRLNLVLPFLISLFFLVQSFCVSESVVNLTYWLGVQPMYPGLVVSVGIFGWDKLIKR